MLWRAGTGCPQPMRAKVMLTPLSADPCVESETDWLDPPIDTESDPLRAAPPIDRRSLESVALPVMVPVWL